MKKLAAIVSLSVLVWGCAKKMTPATPETPSSNTGSVTSSNNETATAAATGSAASAITNTGTLGTKEMPKDASANAENASLMAGQSTYNAKCGRCHGLKVTTDYTELRWVSIMAVMAPKANLGETERANVLAYVRANAKRS